MIQRRIVLLKTVERNLICIRNSRKMSGFDEGLSPNESQLLQECRMVVPPMTQKLYKGQAGRIGVIGGSLDYTGAPYFAAISALKVGCDLSHVFCAKEAAPVIKSYSPELIVHPVLDSSDALELIKPWLPRLHVLVIGPGLGRDSQVLETVSSVIQYCRDTPEVGKPLVVDADGLFMVTEKPSIIKDYPHGAILTPNAIEFSRLAKAVLNQSLEATPEPDARHVKALARALGPSVVVLHKGASDVIASGQEDIAIVKCTGSGSGRRCGGQGDLLSGSLGTFYCWATRKGCRDPQCSSQFPPGVLAAYAGCRLTRECNHRAVARMGRSTLTTDMLLEIHPAFETLFEN